MRYIYSYALVVIQLTSMAAVAASGPLSPPGLAARAIIVVAALLGGWAILAMRIDNYNIFPDIKPGARFVTRGPYRWIRHPMYAAVLLLTLGWLLGAVTPWRVGLWCAHAAVILVKLTVEERLLTAHFDEYAGYAKHTKRLIPFVF